MSEIIKIHEAVVEGCHVVVYRLDEDTYDAYVSYNSYNANGVRVASPTWRNIGNESETKLFIVREVNRARDHNKPKP